MFVEIHEILHKSGERVGRFVVRCHGWQCRRCRKVCKDVRFGSGGNAYALESAMLSMWSYHSLKGERATSPLDSYLLLRPMYTSMGTVWT